MMTTIGRLEMVPLREWWRHEALDFTRWLAENLDLLAEKVGGDLSFVEREVAAGAFSADIVAEDDAGNVVIIENQLERTDHDHLGKLITYMSNLDTKRAIWVSSEPRPEHEKAIHWLNEVLPADTGFYLVKVEAVRIGDSPAAPLFTVVAGPSEAARIVGEEKKELAERHIKRLQFWTELLSQANEKTKLHARILPGRDHWISASVSGVQFNYILLMNSARVEVYVDTGDRYHTSKMSMCYALYNTCGNLSTVLVVRKLVRTPRTTSASIGLLAPHCTRAPAAAQWPRGVGSSHRRQRIPVRSGQRAS